MPAKSTLMSRHLKMLILFLVFLIKIPSSSPRKCRSACAYADCPELLLAGRSSIDHLRITGRDQFTMPDIDFAEPKYLCEELDSFIYHRLEARPISHLVEICLATPQAFLFINRLYEPFKQCPVRTLVDRQFWVVNFSDNRPLALLLDAEYLGPRSPAGEPEDYRFTYGVIEDAQFIIRKTDTPEDR